MMEQQSTMERRTKRKRRKVGLVCLLLAGVLILCAATGAVCWHIRDRQAKAQAEADRQSYLENYNHAHSNAYRWLTDAWNRTLADLYADTVFFGDSLTAGGAWGEWYPYDTCINLGVVGDTVEGLHSRVTQVEMLQPEKCFLMIGVNNLNYGAMAAEVLPQYAALLQDLHALGEETGLTTYVLSVLPVREGEVSYPTTNEQIRALNEGIAELAQGLDMPYVDLHSLFADENGMLKAEYSYDGLHLTELGYYLWQETLIPYMEE